jgi:hypothetical protein
MALGLLLAATPACAITPTPFGVNLVKNPGAEAGTASSDGHATAKEIHIPLGVFLFGMGLFAPFMGFYDLKAQRRPQ